MLAQESASLQAETHAELPRRGAILAAATQLFLTHGYAGASMSAVATACGIRKASLYHHFASKEALFSACVTEAYDAATAALARLRDDPALTHAERVRLAVAELYRVIVDSPVGRLSPLIAEVSLRFPEVARAFHESFVVRQHDIVSDILAAGVTAGDFAPHDRLAMEHMIFGPPVTLSLSRAMFASFPDRDALLPVAEVRDGHLALLMRLLVPEAPREG